MQNATPFIPRFGDGRDQFFRHRFGLFVHWGLYAIPAWHEQHQFRRGTPRAEYGRLLEQFNPACFDPDAWIDAAMAAGMEYLTFTAKHQDGFCLWDSAETEFKVTRSPYGRDVLAQVADACRRRHFPLHVYYSIVDNRHPGYPNQGRWHELPAPEPGDRPDIPAYVEYVRRQVRELCTGYGPLAGFWWDSNDMNHDDPSMNALIRELQPGILINNRGFGPGDYTTPERDWDDSVNHGTAFTKPVEACQSVGVESWGFRADEDYYSERHLLASLAKIWARGGNFLLNAGPMADGRFPERSLTLLNSIGGWLGRVRESYDGTAPASQYTSNPDILLTRRDNTLYVHLIAPPASDRVLLPPLAALPRRAVLLNTGEAVATSLDLLPGRFQEPRPFLRLKNLSVDALASRVPVIRLDFDRLDDVLAAPDTPSGEASRL